MFQRLFPRQLDNTFRGKTIALWIFGAVLTMKLLMGVNCVLMGEDLARAADGIPLDTYTPAGAKAVVALFAVWGVAHITIVLVCLLALIRYRAMVPVLFVVLLLEHLARKLVLVALPIARAGAAPSTGTLINGALLLALLAGIVLSLVGRDPAP